MQGAQSAGCLLAQARVGSEEYLHQYPALVPELGQFFIHRLQQPQGEEMNAYVKRQAGVVKKAANIAIECTDGLKLWLVEQCFRHPDEFLIGINFNLG